VVLVCARTGITSKATKALKAAILGKTFLICVPPSERFDWVVKRHSDSPNENRWVQVVCVTSQGLIAKSGAGVVGLETSAQAEAVDDQIHLLW